MITWRETPGLWSSFDFISFGEKSRELRNDISALFFTCWSLSLGNGNVTDGARNRGGGSSIPCQSWYFLLYRIDNRSYGNHALSVFIRVTMSSVFLRSFYRYGWVHIGGPIVIGCWRYRGGTHFQIFRQPVDLVESSVGRPKNRSPCSINIRYFNNLFILSN